MNWHSFALRFPLLEGEERESLKESIKSTNGIDEQPILFRVVNGKIEGLDGRNREGICEELGIKAKSLKVVVADKDVKAFIVRRNVTRRHLSREFVAIIVIELRDDGLSTRVIAEAVGVSQSTVVRILEKPGEPNDSPGAPTSLNLNEKTVFGRDGKEYSAHPQPKLCNYCRKHTPKPNCKDCKAANEPPREPGDDTEAEAEAKKAPKNGQVLWNWNDFESKVYGPMERAIDSFARSFGKLNTPEVEALRTQLRAFHGEFKKTYGQLKKGVKK